MGLGTGGRRQPPIFCFLHTDGIDIMTGYTVHTGSNDNFRDGWDQIFSGAKKKTSKGSKTRAKKKAPRKKKTRQSDKKKR